MGLRRMTTRGIVVAVAIVAVPMSSATGAVRHWRAWFEKREYDKALSNYDDFIRVYPNEIVVHIRRATAFVLMLSFWRRILFGAIALGALVGFVSWVLGVI
jgi:hypothetical protein